MFTARGTIHLLLLATIVCLSSLPSLGQVWHAVLPHHDHIYLGDASVSVGQALQNPADACAECASAWLHLPNPSGALSLFALIGALASPFFFFVPHFSFWRLAALADPDSLLNLPPSDPPPRQAVSCAR